MIGGWWIGGGGECGRQLHRISHQQSPLTAKMCECQKCQRLHNLTALVEDNNGKEGGLQEIGCGGHTRRANLPHSSLNQRAPEVSRSRVKSTTNASCTLNCMLEHFGERWRFSSVCWMKLTCDQNPLYPPASSHINIHQHKFHFTSKINAYSASSSFTHSFSISCNSRKSKKHLKSGWGCLHGQT